MQCLLFSDLHYSHETREQCFQVLQFIHATAIQKGLRVLFLGDFWDHVYRRGTLPVDLLNEMIRFFKETWTVDTIMIPGNHDYFDSAENESGLEAFKDINNIRVYNDPQLLDGALFLPYRKDYEIIKKTIQETDKQRLKVIFGHLDTVGASMNNHRLSSRGCSKEDYPVPTYSGHYHTASSYGNITYIGSPYQVHLNEAGDEKSLCVVDCGDGSLVERIPIDVGRKQYKVTHDVTDLSFLLEKPLKKGDRVVIETVEGVHVGTLSRLQELGVVVDVKKFIPPCDVAPRLENVDDDPVELWKRYLHAVNQYAMLDMSMKHLFSHDAVRTYKPPLRDVTKVTFDRMKIGNFGPFVGEHNIALEDGMTLITGSYHGKDGTDSNGVGKSLYTSGAFLWVCTGHTDPRFGANAKVTNGIISYEKSSTFVILNGTVNGIEFTISRNMTLDGTKGTHTLMFHMNGADMGNNTTKLTQHQINRRVFGLREDSSPASTLYDYITRTTVWTQRNSPKFLDSSDVSSKNELAMIANIDYWKTLHTYCKSEAKESQRNVDRWNVRIEECMNRVRRQNALIGTKKARIDEWHADNAREILRLEEELQAIVIPETAPVRIDVDALRQLVATKQKSKKVLTNQRHTYRPPVEWMQEWCRREANNKLVQTQLKKVKADGDVCDVCLSKISPEQVQLRKKELAARIEPMDDLTAQRDKDEMEWTQKKEEETKVQLDQLASDIADLSRRINDAEIANKDVVAYERDRDRLARLQQEQSHHQTAKCPFNVSDDLTMLDTLKKTCQDMEAQRATEVERQTWTTTLCSHLGPCGIQSFLLESTSKHLVGLIHAITNDRSFKISVSAKEKLVKTFDGKALSALSGGEFQRLQIACFLAYRRLLQDTYGWSSNLLILDEPDTYVDASGVKAMMEMVRKHTDVTLIVSHTNSMHRDMAMFDNHIELVRDAAGSRKRKRV